MFSSQLRVLFVPQTHETDPDRPVFNCTFSTRFDHCLKNPVATRIEPVKMDV